MPIRLSGKKERYRGIDTGHEVDITRSVSKAKRRFAMIYDDSLDKLSDDLDNEAFNAAFKTLVRMMKRLKPYSDEVTIYPDEIAAERNKSQVSIRTHLKILEERGYIKKKYPEKGRHVYIINKDVISKG